MIDTKQALTDSTRSQYFGKSKQTLLMKLSFKLEYSVKRLLRFLPEWRYAKIDRTLQHTFEVGERVSTRHGGATVISSEKAIASNGEDGFISVNVRFDTPPEPSLQNGKIDRYPYIGSYNQIFLERE